MPCRAPRHLNLWAQSREQRDRLRYNARRCKPGMIVKDLRQPTIQQSGVDMVRGVRSGTVLHRAGKTNPEQPCVELRRPKAQQSIERDAILRMAHVRISIAVRTDATTSNDRTPHLDARR
jgi:hypothetical protein